MLGPQAPDEIPCPQFYSKKPPPVGNNGPPPMPARKSGSKGPHLARSRVFSKPPCFGDPARNPFELKTARYRPRPPRLPRPRFRSPAPPLQVFSKTCLETEKQIFSPPFFPNQKSLPRGPQAPPGPPPPLPRPPAILELKRLTPWLNCLPRFRRRGLKRRVGAPEKSTRNRRPVLKNPLPPGEKNVPKHFWWKVRCFCPEIWPGFPPPRGAGFFFFRVPAARNRNPSSPAENFGSRPPPRCPRPKVGSRFPVIRRFFCPDVGSKGKRPRLNR